ncbi:MAG: hypothetical protein Ct9H90mP30_6730 [Actinomycetota bacterium]|nr:MAG: hypothetical protein Ct9H90mP30_6730 [Actinomycetota bacterium]
MRTFDREWKKGISLAGDDIGTPIIGFEDEKGETFGIFGPVITRVPDKRQSLELWDSVVLLTPTPGFWEFKTHEDRKTRIWRKTMRSIFRNSGDKRSPSEFRKTSL